MATQAVQLPGSRTDRSSVALRDGIAANGGGGRSVGPDVDLEHLHEPVRVAPVRTGWCQCAAIGKGCSTRPDDSHRAEKAGSPGPEMAKIPAAAIVAQDCAPLLLPAPSGRTQSSKSWMS